MDSALNCDSIYCTLHYKEITQSLTWLKHVVNFNIFNGQQQYGIHCDVCTTHSHPMIICIYCNGLLFSCKTKVQLQYNNCVRNQDLFIYLIL